MVLEVSPRGLTLSLPQGLRGSVVPEEVGRGRQQAQQQGLYGSSWRV
jgi:hypothetical protein